MVKTREIETNIPDARNVVCYKKGRDKDKHESRAKKITERRKAEYAAEVEKAGEPVRRLMAVSTPIGGENGSAAEDKPKIVITVMASPKSCVVRKLPAGRREAMIRELIENGSKVQEKQVCSYIQAR